MELHRKIARAQTFGGVSVSGHERSIFLEPGFYMAKVAAHASVDGIEAGRIGILSPKTAGTYFSGAP